MASPQLSIGLPVYNGGRHLAEALDALLNQDFADFELIVSDNASTDATPAICQACAVRDPRVRYTRLERNLGAAPNHRRVVDLARAPFFKWAAHDDAAEPSMLRRCMEVIQTSAPSIALVYPAATLIDDDGRSTGMYSTSIACDSERPSIRLRSVLRKLELGTPMYGVAQTALLRQTRQIDGFFGADRVFLAEVAMLGRIVQLDEPLLKKRLHPGRSMAANKTPEEFARWYDPRATVGRLGPTDRIDYEILRSIWRLPIAFRERVWGSWFLLTCSQTQSDRRRRWLGRMRRLVGGN